MVKVTTLMVDQDISYEEAERIFKSNEKISSKMNGMHIKKLIHVPNH